LGRDGVAADRELVALGAEVEAELFLDAGEVLVELAVERARIFVVVEGQDDMRDVRRPRRRGGFQACFGAQASLLFRTSPSSGRLGKEAGRTRLRDSHPDNVADFPGRFINDHRLEPGRAADDLAGTPPGLL